MCKIAQITQIEEIIASTQQNVRFFNLKNYDLYYQELYNILA